MCPASNDLWIFAVAATLAASNHTPVIRLSRHGLSGLRWSSSDIIPCGCRLQSGSWQGKAQTTAPLQLPHSWAPSTPPMAPYPIPEKSIATQMLPGWALICTTKWRPPLAGHCFLLCSVPRKMMGLSARSFLLQQNRLKYKCCKYHCKVKFWDSLCFDPVLDSSLESPRIQASKHIPCVFESKESDLIWCHKSLEVEACLQSSERKTKSKHRGSNAPKVPRSGVPRHRPQNGEAMPSEACSVQIEARALGAPSQAGKSLL